MSIRINYSNKWTFDESLQIYELFEKKTPYRQICQIMHRSYDAVREKKMLMISNLLMYNEFETVEKLSYSSNEDSNIISPIFN